MAESETSAPGSTIDANSKWAVLGALRFFLASIVVSSHLTWFVRPHSRGLFLSRFSGQAAIIGFLFISGFSIAHSIHRKPHGFYRRRVARIFPMYILCVLMALLIFDHRDHLTVMNASFDAPSVKSTVLNLALLQTWVTSPTHGNQPVWTLAVEVAFYGFAPLFALASEWLLVYFIALSAVAFALHQRFGMPFFADEIHGLPLVFLAWAWVGGFYVYRASNSNAGTQIVALTAILVSYHTNFSGPLAVPTATLSALAVSSQMGFRLRPAVRKGAILLGDLSFPMYLFHLPTLILMQGRFHLSDQRLLLASVILVSSAALAVDEQIQPLLARMQRVRIKSEPVSAAA